MLAGLKSVLDEGSLSMMQAVVAQPSNSELPGVEPVAFAGGAGEFAKTNAKAWS